MSVFNFVKNAGNKLFGRGKSEPEALKDHASNLGLNSESVSIDYSDGRVTASGTASSQEDKEKLLLALGNVDGVESVDESITVADSAADNEPRFYTVQSGDTLGAIAQRHYGKASQYMKIFEANKPMLEHPDRIYPGQVLRIPD
jgi:nucleoid-associated protein YgaU